MPSKIDLKSAVSARCKKMMSDADYNPPPISDEDTIYAYASIMHRRVLPKKRTVHKASYFVPTHLVVGEQNLLKKVVDGDDLWPHQSRNIGRVSAQDGMLNDYDIQHFHLGTTTKAGTKLIEGTKELLFAVVKENDFYAIGIYGHNDWTDQSVLDVVHQTWP
jgi:hypothetical protein